MNQINRALIEQNILFKGMEPESFDRLLEHSTLRSLQAGERLLQPEDRNQHLHLILEGRLNVHLIALETAEFTSLLPGDCVGEVSMVDGKYPSAIVIAAEPTRILSVPHDTVWSLINSSREVANNLLGILAGRLRRDNSSIAEAQITNKQLEVQASIDPLTGVYNRHWMNKAFPRALNRCARNRQPYTVMVVDIDHFKKVNDTYGHLVGDLALKTVARCMADNLRPHDLMARFGGEEFAVLLTEADLDSAMVVAERLRQKIAESPIDTGDAKFTVTLSIGITPSQSEDGLEGLIREADEALYRAKKMGRNRVEVFH